MNANVLLSVATMFAFALLTMTATVYGAPDPWWRYLALAVVVTLAFLALSGPVMRLMRRPPQGPLISRASPETAIWAAVYPALILLGAALPLIFRGVDFGLAVVIAAVFFGVTVLSALASLRDGDA